MLQKLHENTNWISAIVLTEMNWKMKSQLVSINMMFFGVQSCDVMHSAVNNKVTEATVGGHLENTTIEIRGFYANLAMNNNT